MKSKFGLALNIVAVLLVFTYGMVEYVVPKAAASFWEEDYKALMFQCDHVMREHFIAKQLVLTEPSEKAVKNLDASEVGLLSCHEYDKLRKTLLSYGVSEAQLSLTGLEAIEENANEVRRFVEIHEIRY